MAARIKNVQILQLLIFLAIGTQCASDVTPVDNCASSDKDMTPVDNSATSDNDMFPVDNSATSDNDMFPVDNSASSDNDMFPVDNNATSNNDESEICTSIECIILAGQISQRLNVSEDPCNDFYNYACGNFKSVVKYDPALNPNDLDADLKTTQVNQMEKRQEDNIYEMLILDSVATSNDTDVSELYGLARNLYRSCRLWHSKTERRNSGQEKAELSAKFLLDTYNYMIHTMNRAAGQNEVSIESVLAALIKTGSSYLNISQQQGFLHDAIHLNDLKLNNVSRAVIQLNLTNIVLLRPAEVDDYLAASLNGSGDLNWSDVSSTFDAAFSAVSDVSGFQRKLATCRNYLSVINDDMVRVELKELDSITACLNPTNPFSWTRFFTELLEANIGNEEIFWLSIDDTISVAQYVTYLKSHPVRVLDQLTGQLRFSDQVSWLILDWLLGFTPFLPQSMGYSTMLKRTTHAHYSELASHLELVEKSYKLCQDVVVKQLHPIVERMYQRAYHREDFGDVERIIKMVKRATIASMKDQDWITPYSKLTIAQKIELMDETAGIFSARSLRNFYQEALEDYRSHGLNSNASSEVNFGTLMAIAALSNERIKFDLMSGKWPLTKLEAALYGESTLDINAYYTRDYNHLSINMGFMDPPIYHHSYPDYIKLGSIGSIIGHEIGHGFNTHSQSLLYHGKEGRLFDDETMAGFNERATCVQKRYAEFTMYPDGPYTNSTATADEDIADMIGITAADKAMQILISERHSMPRLPDLSSKFTQEKLLFIQAAQGFCTKAENLALDKLVGKEHSFNRLRVLGMAMNNENFAKAFDCPANAPMNPREKCIFW